MWACSVQTHPWTEQFLHSAEKEQGQAFAVLNMGKVFLTKNHSECWPVPSGIFMMEDLLRDSYIQVDVAVQEGTEFGGQWMYACVPPKGILRDGDFFQGISSNRVSRGTRKTCRGKAPVDWDNKKKYRLNRGYCSQKSRKSLITHKTFTQLTLRTQRR